MLQRCWFIFIALSCVCRHGYISFSNQGGGGGQGDRLALNIFLGSNITKKLFVVK